MRKLPVLNYSSLNNRTAFDSKPMQRLEKWYRVTTVAKQF